MTATIDDVIRRDIKPAGRSIFECLAEVQEHRPKPDSYDYAWSPIITTNRGFFQIDGGGDAARFDVKISVPFGMGDYIPEQLTEGLWRLSRIEPALLNCIDIKLTDYLDASYLKTERGKTEVDVRFWGWSGPHVTVRDEQQSSVTYNLRNALISRGLGSTREAIQALQGHIGYEAQLRKVPSKKHGDSITLGKGTTAVNARLLMEELRRRPQQLTLHSNISEGPYRGPTHMFRNVTVKQEALTLEFGFIPMDKLPGDRYNTLVAWFEQNKQALDEAVMAGAGQPLLKNLQTPWSVQYKRKPNLPMYDPF